MKKDSNSKWKDFLLKSGLPLEYEVKKVLDNFGFWSQSEFSYFRNDEQNLLNEFSYDIDSYKVIEEHRFELMIECKYRHDSTNWIFLPEDYNNSDRGAGTTDFRNTNDLFYRKDYSDFFKILNFKTVAPLCSKGIEISTTGPNTKSITQAISQLSFGLIHKVVSAMRLQLDSKDEYDHKIYHHIPIIFTTANLRRLKPSQNISSIKKAKSLDEISVKEDILLIEPKISLELKKYNIDKLDSLEREYTKEVLEKRLHKRHKTFEKNFDHSKNFIADEFPQGIIVIHHNESNSGIKKLNDILDEIVRPKPETIKLLEDQFGTEIRAFDEFKK